MVGVGDAAAAPRIAEVARALGTERTFVVHGAGVDELPLDGTGVLYDVDPDGVAVASIDPDAVGLALAATAELGGGSAAENAAIIERIFDGEAGPRRDVVLLNAGAALLVAGRAADLAEGVEGARTTLEGGAPVELLARLRASRAAHESSVADDGAAGVGSAPAPSAGVTPAAGPAQAASTARASKPA